MAASSEQSAAELAALDPGRAGGGLLWPALAKRLVLFVLLFAAEWIPLTHLVHKDRGAGSLLQLAVVCGSLFLAFGFVNARPALRRISAELEQTPVAWTFLAGHLCAFIGFIGISLIPGGPALGIPSHVIAAAWYLTGALAIGLAGLALVPMLAGWAVGSVFGVRLMIRGGMRASVGGGFAISAVGAALLALMAYEHAHIGWAFAALALLGVGLGPAASTSIIGPQSVVPWRARSVVTSAVYSTRMLGGAVAIALLHLWHGSPTLQVMLIAPIGLVGGLLLLAMAPAGRMDEIEGLDLVVE